MNEPETERGGCSLQRPCSAIVKVLQNPTAVWVNMLRGTIAIPTALVEKSRVHVAVNEEPECPGDMPDEMWEAIRDDRDAVAEAIRIAVRQTKQNILNRVEALESPNK